MMFTEDLALNPMGTLENALDFMGLDLVDAAGIEVSVRVKSDAHNTKRCRTLAKWNSTQPS